MNMNESARNLIPIMTAFSSVSKLPVTLFDRSFQILWTHGEGKKFCGVFSESNFCKECCVKTLNATIQHAINLKEPYIFQCDAGLLNIMFPVQGKVPESLETFLIGPIAMGTQRQRTIEKIVRRFHFSKTELVKLVLFTDTMEIKTPAEISHIYQVFCSCVLPHNALESDFGLLSDSGFKEKRSPETTSHYPSSIWQDLIHAILCGDEAEARKHYRLFYEKNYLLEAGSFNHIKIKNLELFEQISNALIEEHFSAPLYLNAPDALQGAYTFQEVYRKSLELISALCRANTEAAYQGHSAIVKDTIQYMKGNFKHKITLDSVAQAAHANASYLSSLFKAETGISFSQYLTQLRLNHGANLLLNTHLSITNIALACGFSNQSYFIKLFREKFHMTPSAFRSQRH